MGWNRPFWFVYKPRDWKLTGKQLSGILHILDTGDLLITRVDGKLTTWLLPGWWSHAGVCVSMDTWGLNDRIVHAIGEGVLNSNVLDFLRADHAVILRPSREVASKAVGIAQSLEGGDYDFGFDFSDTTRLSCTELAAACYGAIKPKKTWYGKKIVKADDIVALEDFRIIWDSRK